MLNFNKGVKVKKLILLFLLPILLTAQDGYEEWQKKENQRFQNFVSEEDKKFADLLEQDWKKFQMSKGVKFDETPKVAEMPVFKEKVEEEVKKEPNTESIDKKVEEVIPVAPIIKTEISIAPQIVAPQIPAEAKTLEFIEAEIDYYGFDAKINIPKNINVKLGGVNNKSISQFWKEISGSNYKPFLEQTKAYKEEMGLSDWGYIQLLNDIGKEVFKSSRNERYLFVWFMLVKSEYKAKVGIIGSNVYLIINTKNTIYRTIFYTTKTDEKQYVINLENTQFETKEPLYTFNEDFPGSDNLIYMDINKQLKLNNSLIGKILTFTWKDVQYQVPVKYSKTVVDFYSKYPHSSLDIYFNARKTNIVKESLLNSLSKIIEGKSVTEAANILLRFAQDAFGYKTDPDQFGYEKPLFVEETLFYPYSDCEDRSIIYAYLVRSLLNLEVVAVDYPGHVATAVNFGNENTGDFVTYKDKKYTVCDPTYMGANIGNAQPEYKNSKIENIFRVE